MLQFAYAYFMSLSSLEVGRTGCKAGTKCYYSDHVVLNMYFVQDNLAEAQACAFFLYFAMFSIYQICLMVWTDGVHTWPPFRIGSFLDCCLSSVQHILGQQLPDSTINYAHLWDSVESPGQETDWPLFLLSPPSRPAKEMEEREGEIVAGSGCFWRLSWRLGVRKES